MYLGVASPTGTPVLAVTALQNVQSGAPFLAAGLGLTDALEAGVCYEGTNGGGMNAGSPIFTVMGDFTGFYEDAPTRCFPAHTRIQTSRTTSTAISALRVGDVVLAFDARADKGRGALVPRRVARLYRNTTTE